MWPTVSGSIKSLFTDQSMQKQVPLVISLYMVGLMIGSFMFGTLADKIGRKKMFMIAAVLSSG